MAFACSLLACVGSLLVLQLNPTVQKHDCYVNWCVHGCLSCVSLCCPAMDWRLVQVYPASRRGPLEIGTSSFGTLYGRSRYRKWMDGFECSKLTCKIDCGHKEKELMGLIVFCWEEKDFQFNGYIQ
ncbi:hypothetical protein CHARACLAT_015502 [Characodon lateralis]|uniref:Uncharacterized protein n=1 Tax=Characodon lateralis TaxID=208331 RepID=A0ABU7F4A6_9TELE|nr:hypothetical protein [Characodon lateralis]